MPALRNIRKPAEEEIKLLQDLYCQTEDADTRTYCQMILLSNQGHSVAEIAHLTFFDVDLP